uniref:Zinc finger and Peptidase A2A domain containing protein n=1 Tax=Haemonchus contortus TaxID=6289 RepID=W6NEC1_HAECO
MRTDDPRRETVVASVREQVALVREIAKATLAEICELSKPKVAERVFELVREGQIGSVSQLQEHMKKWAATTKMVEEVCETLHCHDFEVSMRVKGLSAALNVERRTSDELRLQIIQKDLQIEQLRQEVEGLGQREANSSMEQDNGNEAAQGESACRPCGSIETQNAISEALQGKASRISMPSHQQYYETMRREEFEPRRGTRQSSATGEPIEFSLGDYIRTMSLPEVQPFCGRPGECFKRFVSSFNMKYPREQWRDSNRVQLFQSFLRKNALTIFETLPREVREGTYDEVIETMKARMRIDGNSQRVKALADLRLLAMRPGQSLSESCFALESLANRAYLDMPPVATSLQKAEILCRQLASWNGSYCLTEALETSTCDEAYEKVKEVALRLERSLKTAEECRLLNKGKTEIRYRHRTPERRGGSGGDQNLDTSSSGSERAAKPLVDSRPESVHSQKKKRERDPPRCYNCGNMGHLAKHCRSRPNPQQRTPTRANAQQRPRVAYASPVEKWVCTSWWEPASKTSELFGEKPLAVITLCGIEATALLDTGSQTTIIPVRLLKKAIDRKVDLDEYIERIPGPNTKVRDASGNIMEFFDTNRIAIRLEDQVKVVSAFVGRSPDETVILGTNALELFNLRLLKGTEAKSEHMAAKRTASVAAQNPALICNINENEESIRIPFDARIVVPNEVESSARTTKTKKKMRRRANSNKIACRATTDGNDTSPLGLFFRCPGRHGQESDGYRYSCTIQEETFKDVVPDAPEAIANLRCDKILGLARLLSIYEHERNEERKRFLMLDHKYFSISVTLAQKAFLFYKKFCDHVFRSLILHVGPSLCLPHDGGTGWPIEQPNQATNEAVRYAQANSWDEVNVKEPNTTLLILPDSFRAITAAFRENAYVERRLYSKLSEVSGFLERSVARICVLVSPTTDEPPVKRDWCNFASSLATAARMGMSYSGCAPRGDKSYMQNRADMNDATELAKSAAVLMKQGLRSLIPVIESPHERSHGP